ncbi:MAG: sugar transferase [Thermus sp.]|nr:sugar transferase [Thermus sp.]
MVDLGSPSPRVLAWIREASLRGLPVWHVATVYERFTGRVLLDQDAGLQEGLWAVAGVDRRPYMLFKRVWETLLVLAFSPFLLLAILLVSLLVYLDLGRPVIFSQERVGLGGKVFRAYKFRTMRGTPRAGVYAGDEKDRITPLGRFLRRYRLDELPQFWNVLKGDMSLIGPRPEQKVLVEAYSAEIPLYCFRHVVRPGITGWAQVYHGYAEGKEGTWDKLSYDLFYVKHFSFWLDVRILIRTAWVVVTGFGAK